MAKFERKDGTYMDRTGKVLHGIRSDAVDSLCATCRNELFGLVGRSCIGCMCVWNAFLMGKYTIGD